MMRVLAGLTIAMLASGAWAAPPAKPAYQGPHNVYGQPDFEGAWSMNSMTRLERPASIPNLVLTPEQLKIPPAQILPSDSVGTARVDPTDSFQAGWSRLGDEYRSSWIIEPSDGRLPYSDAGRKLMAARGGSDNPEAPQQLRALPDDAAERPADDQQRLQQQHPVPADPRHHRHAAGVQPRGADHPPEHPHPGAAPQLVRRFRRLVGGRDAGGRDRRLHAVPDRPPLLDDAAVMSPQRQGDRALHRISKTQIKYEFSVDDPAVFTQAVAGRVPLTVTTEPTFEYACHEGNYGLANILSDAALRGKRSGRRK